MPGKNHMQKIILSADSTCDLDKELKERYHVNYFPLHINLNGKDYLDNVDITVNALLGCHDLDLSCCREIAGISVMECSI